MMESERIDRLFEHAADLARRGLLDRAIDLLRQILTEDPDHASAHAMLAICLVDKKRLHAARFEAEQALATDPMSGLSQFAIARVCFAQNQPDQAIAHLENAREIEPWDADNVRMMGIIVEAQGRFDAAEELYQKAVELGPDDPHNHAALGQLLCDRGRLDEAATLAREALELEPAHPEALVLEGKLELLRGNVESARQHAIWALQSDANDENALHLLADIKARQSFFLGLWWRYSTWMGTLTDTRSVIVLVGAFLVARVGMLICDDLELTGGSTFLRLAWLGVVAYSWFGPAWFASALEKELGQVELDDDF